MTTAGITMAFVIILAVAVIVLNKKSIDRDNANESSVTEVSSGLNKRCDAIKEDIANRDKAVMMELESLRSDAFEQVKRSQAAICEAKQQAADSAEDTFRRSVQYADQKAVSAAAYADELHDDLVAQLEERIIALATLIDSLNEENARLRQELNEQKKKLNFYAGIEDAAADLTVTEDADDRKQKIEAAKKQFAVRKEKSSGVSEYNEGKTGQSTDRQAGTQQIFAGTATISGQAEPRTAEEMELESEERILDDEQEFALDYMENTKDNVFITGKAGTGKSFLLDVFRMNTGKENIVLGPTGISALNVRGATLHSTFGYYNLVNLGVDDISNETIRLKSEKRSILKSVSTIIIDEISMVRADTFDKIDRILKAINRSDLPFGGKQMLVFGDLFQLPPVAKGQEHEYLRDRYGGIFFFHSNAYKKGHFKFIELSVNHRQKGDEAFFGILNRIREGTASNEDIALLNSRYMPDESIYDRYIALFPTKEEAERVNRSRISQLPSEEYIYKAKITLNKNPNKNKSIDSVFPVSEELRLRLGANVMMVANDPEGRWVNGTLGIVKDLSKDRIVVSFGKGRNYEVQPTDFDEQEIAYTDGKIIYEKVFSVLQYPIIPAYAITIHKSQGQTYNNIMCDIERCFASGQAYVALSRCASLEGLRLKSPVTSSSIKVDHEVLDFYHEQQENDLLN